MRLTGWLATQAPPLSALRPVAGLVKRHLGYKYGISIPSSTCIGPGLYISHFGEIVVNGACVIGANCTISHGVTLGINNRGKRPGVPVVGDNVFLGPGCKLVGHVCVGSNVMVGANAVVTRDVQDNCVMGGVPAEVLSYGGAAEYIVRTDYPAVPCCEASSPSKAGRDNASDVRS